MFLDVEDDNRLWRREINIAIQHKFIRIINHVDFLDRLSYSDFRIMQII